MADIEKWYSTVNEVEQELKRLEEDAAISSTSRSGCSAARCVWCDSELHDSPTDHWWIRGITHDTGLCYRCIVNSFRTVICGLKAGQQQNKDLSRKSPGSALSD
jgi:hypothetical protein